LLQTIARRLTVIAMAGRTSRFAGTLRPAIVLVLICCVDGVDRNHGLKEEQILRSAFDQSSDGWTIEGGAAGIPLGPSVSLSLDRASRALTGSDTASDEWYFTSPESFTGDHSALYNGELHFAMWHAHQPRGGSSDAAPAPKVRHPYLSPILAVLLERSPLEPLSCRMLQISCWRPRVGFKFSFSKWLLQVAGAALNTQCHWRRVQLSGATLERGDGFSELTSLLLSRTCGQSSCAAASSRGQSERSWAP
jgi:hypothetical protein